MNHRISLWKVYPEQNDCLDPADASLIAAFVGGSWSTGQTWTDTPSVDYRYSAVDIGEGAAFLPLRATLWLQAPADEGTVELEIPLAEKGMSEFADYMILLSGLELSTSVTQFDPDYPDDYEPSMGYTSRGIGAAVQDLSVQDGIARFSAWARFDHGPADRSDMNLAMTHARTKAVVHASLVGINGGASTEVEHGYDLIYDAPSFLFQSNYEHAPEELRRLEIQGQAGFDNAFIALKSFDLALFGSTSKGDYIRDFSVQAEILNYDSDTGLTVVDVDGYASNAGLLTYEQMENSFQAKIALIQIPAGTAKAGELKAEFETGEIVLPVNDND